MKTKLFAVLTFGLLAIIGRADPIQIAYGPVMTQPSNYGDGTVATWALNSIATFNTMGYEGAPLPTSLGSTSLRINQGDANPLGGVFGDSAYSITLDLSGYNYIVLSWGGSKIPGDRGTADYLYYVNGANSWTFFDSHVGATGNGTAALANGGLSSVTVYGTPSKVSDAVETVGLLVLGLLVLGMPMLRRRTA